ncbi:hypothetical protein I203_104697 [Kwoniella mangroviensis CBS 8507]|uniref:uncharacterized protein n=1 Tax=Kwoniella mangroviensis CBS 8507 TaxID=1296122 RepID=UPI00080D05B7|nr:uncharacterized protein I203_00358 [Kwoniella mangroviensis CBS 8507]OCF70226.1 hypothetical protein I203_00358 [Kwoniella mangroviensis CBS 8507]
MAAVMQPSTHRPPSMDRAPSFDQPRSRSTPPFTSPYDSPTPHVRTNSTSSNASPYNQPFSNSYFPPSHHQQMYGAQQSWTANPVPATAFYNPPFHGFPNGHQPVYNQFQQSQADFAAWANAYQHMIMASVQNGGHPGGMTPPAPGSDHSSYERRRTSSGPGGQTLNGNTGYFDHPSYQHQRLPQPPQQPSQQIDYSNTPTPPQSAHTKQPQPPQPYHPYKRGPSAKPSTERLPRSSSMPTGLQEQVASISRSSSGQVAQDQTRTHSSHAPPSRPNPPPAEKQPRPPVSAEEAIVSPLRIGDRSRTNSSGSERSAAREVPPAAAAASARTASPAPRSSTSMVLPARASTPLHPGPITNATNTPSASRPSPLSQPSSTPEPTDKMVKTGDLKGRLRKALDKDAKKEQRSVSAPSAPSVPIGKQSLPPKHFASPSESSTRSATPPATPPQEFRAPSAPFTMNPAAMGSEISLAETERTATVSGEQKEKGKRSLFRMKNMSTDNISLSSTVSSASMMIRKMGSIGKLARRNSLMGISRIFKDKPKDGEDAALPEKEGKKKKDKKKKGKGEAAPATISHAVAESDRLTEEEDRALAGLSPAAKLARQHTLRSKAEAVKKDATAHPATGEPTWDQNTATRQAQNGNLPSLGSMGASMSNPNGSTGPEVVRVNHAQAPTVVHAVAVTDQEYDSEDDSSEGETVEDVTMTLAKTRLSAEADAEFQATWGNAWIDRNAVPKKGILKSISSYSNLDEAPSSGENRQRSNSTHTSSSNNAPGPLAQLPSSNPALLDGLVHPSPQVDPAYDPFSPAFSPFDSPTTTIGGNETFYANPNQNSSAPALSLLGTMGNKPPQNRSMTAPVVRRRINWAPECAVYQTYDSGTYDRRSEPATCNRLTPELAMSIKQELNAFKLEMPVHPSSKMYTHYFAW